MTPEQIREAVETHTVSTDIGELVVAVATLHEAALAYADLLPPEGTKRLVVVGSGKWDEEQRCESCDGSGVTPEDHGQGMVEYLGCMDCWGLGVRPDALALLREDSP